MKMSLTHESDIIRSWHINASPWINAIKKSEIESRILATNQAIVNNILSSSPTSLLDLGCGDGWLARALIDSKIRIYGIDAIPTLIDEAKKINNGIFDICTYEALPSYQFKNKFDCIVCNFSLIGKESTDIVIKTCPKLLESNGKLLIQTLHPVVACGNFAYETGWRSGSWEGFSNEFKMPAPWYFRTIENWFELLNQNGFRVRVIEPLHPKLNRPASIIFDCQI